MIVWITTESQPPSSATRAAAEAAGATAILHGIPPRLEGVIPAGTFGAFELPPEPDPEPTPAQLLRAEIAALPAPTMPADVLDVLDRALAFLDGA